MVSSEGWGVQLKHIATVPGGSGSKEEGKNWSWECPTTNMDRKGQWHLGWPVGWCCQS
jgi:hypothetical protein